MMADEHSYFVALLTIFLNKSPSRNATTPHQAKAWHDNIPLAIVAVDSGHSHRLRAH